MKTIQFNGEPLTIHKGFYNTKDNRISLRLTDNEGIPYMTATVNIPDADCPKDHTFIKDWSENDGILEALVKNNIVEDTGKIVPTGFCIANLVKVLI